MKTLIELHPSVVRGAAGGLEVVCDHVKRPLGLQKHPPDELTRGTPARSDDGDLRAAAGQLTDKVGHVARRLLLVTWNGVCNVL